MSHAVEAKVWQTKNTVALARSLVGKVLARRLPDGTVRRHAITEVEAYDGEHDRACHASRGRTARTDVMYRAGGIWYVYLCYGMHEMLNLVTGPEGYPAAVLIRGLSACSGPGRLTKALGIGRDLNGTTATTDSGLWIEDDGVVVPRRAIRATPRIGVAYAGPRWAAKRWRFVWTPMN
jgi:DNA-3-methyladenine glycosylase